MVQKMVHMKILKKFGGDNLEKSGNKNSKYTIYEKDKLREPFKPNTPNSNEKGKLHKCGGIGHLAKNCLKKAKINEIVENEDQNDKEEDSDSEKDTEESETSEIDQINNIDLIYEVLDLNSKLSQFGTSDTSLTNIQDAKMCRDKQEKGMGYTSAKSSISIVMVENQEAKVIVDTRAYFTHVGKGYLKLIVPDWEGNVITLQGVRFSSASES
ncbi:hypothetical protein O181_024604 [Austropuccinia psidii MF-1]|uniref:Uncharacterized protein n=1 Tax=Austropuccinia psidii MF-1 TaxID=1389203 RepID=A0A9Q3CGJ1_9BASI|nr:hypothetical protein [Austropuccinia psidii MF-1]